jgi:hypothetical protein
MAIPVMPLPIDRLAGQRPPARAEQRSIERDGAGSGRVETTAIDPFALPDKSERTSATVVRLDDRLAQRRPERGVTSTPDRSPSPAISRQVSDQVPPEQGQADALQRIARIVGRAASLAFQAQLIAHNTLSPSAPPTGGQPNQHRAEVASAAYRRRQGDRDTAPLIEPHRPIDLLL